MGLKSLFGKPFSRYIPVSHVHPGNSEAVKDHVRWVQDHPEQFVVIPCPLCGSNNFETVFDNDRYGIPVKTTLCSDCGIMFINPAPTPETVDKFYREGFYDATYRPSVADRLVRNPIENPIDHDRPYDGWSWYRLLMQSGRGFDSVLEIGAGSGQNITPFIQSGSSVTAIELSGTYAEEIDAMGATVIVGNLWSLEGSYDLIIARHVVEHVSQPVELLQRLGEHLSSDGILVVEVPGTLKKLPSIQLAHLVYLSESTMNTVAGLAKLKIDNFQTFAGGGEMIAIMSRDESTKTSITFDRTEHDRVLRLIASSYRLRIRHYIFAHTPNILRQGYALLKKLRR
jgi:SAM-dependent methyltransferase